MPYDPEAVREAYDEIAKTEDAFEKGFSLRNEIPRAFIKRHLRPSDVVLDAGGGSGINAIMMARRCRHVTLVDISPRILELAAVNVDDAGLNASIDLIESDVADLEQFGDAEFSFVVCVGGSYVLEKGERAVQELVRVARRDALLIVGCDSRYGFVRWLLNESPSVNRLDTAMEVYETSAYQAADGLYARLYTAAELTNQLEQTGCEVLDIASTPTILDGWDQSSYPKESREKLVALELGVCTVPELLGVGHHLLCVARKL